jgi:uncharacterized protein involved in cysteine biosynthesis
MHEIAHRFFADISDVPVYEVKYFQFSWRGKAGYVVHGQPKTLKAALLISVGPLLVNTALCSLLTFAIFPAFTEGVSNLNPFVGLVLGWLGLSMGMHAFPSNQDMDMLTHEVGRLQKNGLLTFIATVFSFLFQMANLLKAVWFDLIYAVLVAMALPAAFRLL